MGATPCRFDPGLRHHEEEPMQDQASGTTDCSDQHAGEHGHVHLETCGHEDRHHDGHLDFEHDGHWHAKHGDHWDEHD